MGCSLPIAENTMKIINDTQDDIPQNIYIKYGDKPLKYSKSNPKNMSDILCYFKSSGSDLFLTVKLIGQNQNLIWQSFEGSINQVFHWEYTNFGFLIKTCYTNQYLSTNDSNIILIKLPRFNVDINANFLWAQYNGIIENKKGFIMSLNEKYVPRGTIYTTTRYAQVIKIPINCSMDDQLPMDQRLIVIKLVPEVQWKQIGQIESSSKFSKPLFNQTKRIGTHTMVSNCDQSSQATTNTTTQSATIAGGINAPIDVASVNLSGSVTDSKAMANNQSSSLTKTNQSSGDDIKEIQVSLQLEPLGDNKYIGVKVFQLIYKHGPWIKYCDETKVEDVAIQKNIEEAKTIFEMKNKQTKKQAKLNREEQKQIDIWIGNLQYTEIF